MAIVDPPMVNKLMLVPENNVFIGAQPGSALVIHKTASGSRAEDIAHFFANDPAKASSHFVIGQDGTIVQCVHLVDGAGANCCVETGYDPYWNPLLQKFGNLNRCTISIEHCDPSSSNSTPLTDAQKASSFKLIKWLVDQYGFAKADIKGHNSIDPINRARCPGTYPWQELFAYLQNGGDITVTIFLNTPGISTHFKAGSGNSWICIQTGFNIHGEILNFYRTMGAASAGLTLAGLPTSNERKPEQPAGMSANEYDQILLNHKEITEQDFERLTLRYDPNKVMDSPPGSGSVYVVKRQVAASDIQQQLDAARVQNAGLVEKLQHIEVLAKV
jgi:hypothetical protein